MSAETTYDPDALIKDLGRASDDELEAHFHGVAPAGLVRQGQRVATPRVARDGWRIVGQARDAIDRATDEQLDLLGSVSRETLRLAAHAVRRASELHEQLHAERTTVDATSAEREATFAARRKAIAARRELLHSIVHTVVHGAEPWQTRLDQGYSRASEASSLASSLTLLCDLGDELLASKDPGLAARRKTTRLGKPLLASSRELAAQSREADQRQQQAKVTASVSQGKVDLLDGQALHLLGTIVDAFDRAHDSDPTIARLDVIALRNVLHPPSGKKKATEEPAPAPGE